MGEWTERLLWNAELLFCYYTYAPSHTFADRQHACCARGRGKAKAYRYRLTRCESPNMQTTI